MNRSFDFVWIFQENKWRFQEMQSHFKVVFWDMIYMAYFGFNNLKFTLLKNSNVTLILFIRYSIKKFFKSNIGTCFQEKNFDQTDIQENLIVLLEFSIDFLLQCLYQLLFFNHLQTALYSFWIFVVILKSNQINIPIFRTLVFWKHSLMNIN